MVDIALSFDSMRSWGIVRSEARRHLISPTLVNVAGTCADNGQGMGISGADMICLSGVLEPNVRIQNLVPKVLETSQC